MDLRLKESTEWRQCALIEVFEITPDFFQLVRDDTLRFRVQRAEHSPTGFQWYELWVDASTGERRFARTACAVLTALRRSAKEGFLEGFRIVNGQAWLTIGDNNADMDVDGMTPGNLASG